MTMANFWWLLGGHFLGWVSAGLILWAMIVWNERKDPEDHD